MWRYGSREIARRWIDYIRALIYIENKIDFVTSVNSNEYNYEIKYNNEIINIKITDSPNGWEYQKIFMLQSIYKENIINIWFIWFWWVKNWATTTSDFIEITWQGLAIYWTEIFKTLIDFFWFRFLTFKRFDITLDLWYNAKSFLKNIILWNKDKKVKNSISAVFPNTENPETIYFWKKEIQKNSYRYIRFYNKLLDSSKKDKLYLYQDKYNLTDEDIKKQNITRCEAEIRESLAIKYSIDDLTDNNKMFALIVSSFYNKNKQFFKFLKFDDFIKWQKDFKKQTKKRLESIKNWDLNDFKNAYEQKQGQIFKKLCYQEKFWRKFLNDEEEKRTKTMFLAYAKKLYVNGFDKPLLIDLINSIQD